MDCINLKILFANCDLTTAVYSAIKNNYITS